ncbi:MAG: hypothetical protein Q7U12_08480, partial [Undibacterium sp.]|nr:hypothetical protein [Undibacterium sp.]
PILRRGALIGRLDAKAHRKEGVFELKLLHLEAGVRVSQALVDDVTKAIKSFASWHQTPEIRFLSSNSQEFFNLMLPALR